MEPVSQIFAIEDFLEEERRIPLLACDSPIEDMFLWDYKKVAAKEIRLVVQHECLTSSGDFRLDFLLCHVTDGRQIGIECDGRNFHSASRDCRRDAAIVEACAIDKIYRLRGRDIYFRIHDTLHLLSRCEPWLFSSGGLKNLDTLCGPECLREDYFGPSSQHFPYVGFREYRSQPPDSDESFQYDGYEDYQESTPNFPTIIHWTPRIAIRDGG